VIDHRIDDRPPASRSPCSRCCPGCLPGPFWAV
jgi:hypothetical protein